MIFEIFSLYLGLKVNIHPNVKITTLKPNRVPMDTQSNVNTHSTMGMEDNQHLSRYLQPNDIGRNTMYDNLPDDGIRCARDCAAYPQKRLCYYQFTVEQYSAMGP